MSDFVRVRVTGHTTQDALLSNKVRFEDAETGKQLPVLKASLKIKPNEVVVASIDVLVTDLEIEAPFLAHPYGWNKTDAGWELVELPPITPTS